MTDIAIQVIREYIDEYLFEPRNNWPSDIFEERAYARWAAFELINRIMDNPKEEPEKVIAKFLFDAIRLSNRTVNSEKARIFRIARDVAEEIIGLFL